MNQNYETFKKDFKRDFFVKMVIALKYSKTTRGSSAEFASDIIDLMKEEQVGVAFAKINKLAEIHPELLEILIKRGNEYDAREKEEKMNQIIMNLREKGGEIT